MGTDRTTTADWQTTACILCFMNCGVQVCVEDGHIVRVRGDRANPLSQGYACEKAQQLDYYQNAADRLETPLRRRADGAFESIDWETAISEIAERLVTIRDTYGGESFIQAGGGQANHLSGGYTRAISAAMGSNWMVNSLAQEKTGEYWVDGRLFGHQGAHTAHDIENAEVVMFVGKNPWQSHGFPAARTQINAIARDPNRTLIVVDPVTTESAKRADIHIRVRPGCDAFLLAAMCAIIMNEEGLLDESFIAQRTTGAGEVFEALSRVPVEEFCERAGVSVDQVRETARIVGRAESVSIIEDLGVQQSLHSALNSYLEKLLYLLTGNMGRRGGVNINFGVAPAPGGHTPEGPEALVTPVTGQKMIAGIVPCNALPDEIVTDHPKRFRAMWVNGANLAVTYPDSFRQVEALKALDLLVVVDVAMTETARCADYVLPAASQFEKWDCSLLYLKVQFPENYIHLRPPVVPPRPGTLIEAEIASRVVRAMGALTDDLADLHAAAAAGRRSFAKAYAKASSEREQVGRFAPVVLYETLGPTLPDGGAGAAALWPMAHALAAKEPDAVRRAGHKGDGPELGEALFDAILSERSGVVTALYEYEDNWKRISHEDRRVHLAIDEMLRALDALRDEALPEDPEFPFVLAAGERRSSNALSLMRDPAWRRGTGIGTLRIHPDDAARLGLEGGDRAAVTSTRSTVEAEVETTDTVPRGYVTLPHGYGMLYPDVNGVLRQQGPQVNELTDLTYVCPIAGTPYHKYVPVRVEAVVQSL